MIYRKSYILQTLILSVLTVSLSVSLILYNRSQRGERRIFYFPSYDSTCLCSEIRYVAKHPVQGDEAAFVEDLLLGPVTNRYKRIFQSGVRAEYCFVKDGTMYVGLSKEALFPVDEVSVEKGVELLRLNIVKNFTYLNKIEVAIDGHSVFENGEE